MRLVTSDGVHVAYLTANLTDRNARTFLRNYKEYTTFVERYAPLDDDRAAVNIVALVPMAKQYALWSWFFRGHARIDQLLLDVLEVIVEIARDDRVVHAGNFAINNGLVAKMDSIHLHGNVRCSPPTQYTIK